MYYTGFAIKNIGASHIGNGLPCQDSVHYINEPACVSAAVADGHGSEQYFRSDVGADIAAQTACAKISEFMKMSDISPADENSVKKAIRRLIESIVTEWKISVKNNIVANPFTDAEMAKVPEKYQSIYLPFSLAKVQDYTPFELECKLKPENAELLRSYGTTLIVLGICNDYGIGLHIGDGKCVAIYDDGSTDEPIPWDERCHLNRCTSICDENSVDEFRYHIWRDEMPIAVFAASDGIDDSFANRLHMFYRSTALDFAQNDYQKQIKHLEEMLPEISERGSKDDVSICGIIAQEKILITADALSAALEGEAVTSHINELKRRLDDLRFRYSNTERLLEKCSEEYAEKKEKYKTTLEQLKIEIAIIQKEINDSTGQFTV